jgi:cell division protein FtsI (penicillin-binding protein 3)
MLCLLGGFAAVAWQLAMLGRYPTITSQLMSASEHTQYAQSRPDLVDRNGRMLASDIRVYWLYADPGQIINADETVEKLSRVLPPHEMIGLRGRLTRKTRFEWIKRGLTPKQAKAIHNLGLPGFTLIEEPQRIYPAGRIAAHVLGHTDVDNKGIAGIERYIDGHSELAIPPNEKGERARIVLSLDLRVQHALHEELTGAMIRYQAKAASGIVLDVRTGEVLALAGLPDYDPNNREESLIKGRHNRLYADSYELGSVFKSYAVALALELGNVRLEDEIDVLTPIRMGGFTLEDRHAKKRFMTVEDVFVQSSNTGAARLALEAGGGKLKGFFNALGLLEPIQTELGPTARALIPDPWREVNTMTASYGHGISVSPFAFAASTASLINGGMLIKPTFLPVEQGAKVGGERVVSEKTSASMRHLFWLTAERGTGRNAEAQEYRVGGKTGTAYKPEAGGYSDAVITSFVAGFPMDAPRYLALIVIDEPQPEKKGARTEAGHNAAPTAGQLIRRIAPMLGIAPSRKFDENRQASY